MDTKLTHPLSPRKLPLFYWAWGSVALYLFLLALIGWALASSTDDRQPPQILAVERLPANQSDRLHLSIKGTHLTGATRVSLALDSGGRRSIIKSLPTFGRPQDLLLAGNRVLVANGYRGLQVVSIEDPRHPQIVGSLNMPGHPWSLSRTGNLLLVASMSGGVNLVKISDINNPQLLFTIENTTPAFDVVPDREYAYVLTGKHQVIVFDIRNPRRPREVARLAVPGQPWSGALFGSHLYVCCDKHGLQVIDVTDPRHPFLDAHLSLPGVTRSIALAGGYGYVAAESNGMQVLDLQNPSRPRLVTTLESVGQPQKIFLVGDLAYIADRFHGLQIVDIADPRHPVLRHSLKSHGSCTAVVVRGKIAVLTDATSGIKLLDLENLPPPAAIPPFNYSNRTPLKNIRIRDDLALVTSLQRGLLALDISGGGTPRLVGQCNTPGHNMDLAVHGNLAYVASSKSGVQIIDFSDPTALRLAGHIDTGITFTLAIHQDLLLVSVHHLGLLVYDLATPLAPRFLAKVPLADAPRGFSFAGNLVYIACGRENLLVLDISHPEAPKIIGRLASTWPQRDLRGNLADQVLVRGKVAYLAHSREGLQVIDISHPARPRVLADRDGMKDAAELTLDDHFLYVADMDTGEIHIYDITQPQTPQEVAILDSPPRVMNLALANRRIYTVNSLAGLNVFPVPQVTSPLPGADAQRLEVELPMPKVPGNYTVRVFNANGYSELPGIVEIGRKAGEPAAARSGSTNGLQLAVEER